MTDVLNYLAGGQWRPAYPPINVALEPPTSGKDPTTLTLVVSSQDIHSGDAITLTATLKSAGVALNAKPVIFEQNTGSGWTAVDTENTNVSGVATISPALTPAFSRDYRARFATDVTYVGSTSAVKNVVVRTLQQVKKRFYATWSQAYNESNTQYGSNEDIFQNVDGGAGVGILNKKTLVGFDEVAIQSFLAAKVGNIKITYSVKGKAKFGAALHYYLLGYHDYTSKPANWSDARVDQNLYSGSFGYDDRTFWDTTGDYDGISEQIALADLDDWASGANTGLAFGPATSNSPFYELEGVGNNSGDNANEPWIEFTVTKWLAI